MYFIYFSFALGLHCCVWAFSSCGKQGLLSVVRRSHCGSFSCCGTWAPGWSGFSSSGTGAQLPRGMWNLIPWSSLCPLHWQADSQPLDHQGRSGVSISESLPLPRPTPRPCDSAPSKADIQEVIAGWGEWVWDCHAKCVPGGLGWPAASANPEVP